MSCGVLQLLVQVGFIGAGLAIPLYALYLFRKGASQSLFERRKALSKFNRRWHFYEVNENVAIEYTTSDGDD